MSGTHQGKHTTHKPATKFPKSAKPPSTVLKQTFSKTQTAGKSTSPCPLRKPCNLVEIKLVEAKSDFQDESGKTPPRVAFIRKGQLLKRNESPVLLPNGVECPIFCAVG